MPSRKMIGTIISAKIMATLAFRSLAKRSITRRTMTLILITVAAAETLPWNRATEGNYQTFVVDHSLVRGGTMDMALLINTYGQSINTDCNGLRCVILR